MNSSILLPMNEIQMLNIIKIKLMAKDITLEQAKIEAKTHIGSFNNRAVDIAKKHNVKPKKMNFSSFMR